MQKFSHYLLGLPKTIIFNFKYLPFKDAIKLPVLVSHHVWLKKLSGNVKICDIRTGVIKIGFGNIGIFDPYTSRTIWNVTGYVEFKGRAFIGHGSKISIDGSLILGKDFCINAESSIVSQENITIGDNVLISWDSLIMDTDFHDIYDHNGHQTNKPLPVIIGNKVWIGCRTLILKGVHIADGVVVAAASTVTKSIGVSNSIAGGSPAKILKENIEWK